MKRIYVSAAVIFRTLENGRRAALATERGYGEWKGWWEFPGGKVEAGESAEAALVREIREELGSEVRVEELLAAVEYDYPAFHLVMKCYSCALVSEGITLREHKSAAWLAADALRNVKWLPADELILDKVEALLSRD